MRCLLFESSDILNDQQQRFYEHILLYYILSIQQWIQQHLQRKTKMKGFWTPVNLILIIQIPKISYLGSPAFFGFGSRNSIANNFKERWQILFGNGSCDASQCIP